MKYHLAILRSEESLKDINTVTFGQEPGVQISYGTDDTDQRVIQSYRFSTKDFTPGKAKDWLNANEINWNDFKDASEKDNDPEEPNAVFEFVMKDTIRHIVSGVVLSPDELDSENEFANEEDVFQANISYMTKLSSGGVGSTISHTENLQLGVDLVLIENYIVPKTMKVGDQTIKKGSWIQSYKILSADIWEQVDSGEIVGLSMGALLARVPVNE